MENNLTLEKYAKRTALWSKGYEIFFEEYLTDEPDNKWRYRIAYGGKRPPRRKIKK